MEMVIRAKTIIFDCAPPRIICAARGLFRDCEITLGATSPMRRGAEIVHTLGAGGIRVMK